jgi:hypothetical protein
MMMMMMVGMMMMPELPHRSMVMLASAECRGRLARLVEPGSRDRSPDR